MSPLFQNTSFSRCRMNWCAGSPVSPQTAENADSVAAMPFPRLSSAVNAEKTSTEPNGTTVSRNPWYGAVLTRLYPKKTELVCHARTVKEDELKAACLSDFNGFWKERDGFQEQMEHNIERPLAENNPREEEKLRKREEELQQELISLAESRKNYSHVVSELQKVREQQTELENNRNRRSETVSRITELREFIRSHSEELTEFDETLVRHWIRKITVHPDRLTIEFKTGDIVETG